MSLERKVLQWLASGQSGLSSEVMAFTAVDIEQVGKFTLYHYPLDPADLNRCIMLVDTIPEIREHFPKIASLSPRWKAIIDNWDELTATFLLEAGFNWIKSHRAPQTYLRMKQLLDVKQD